MKSTHDSRFAVDSLSRNALSCNHAESEPATPNPHSVEGPEAAGWESAWIDLGGEG
jgi:hypothetical protein